jgi:hypothetical protein
LPFDVTIRVLRAGDIYRVEGPAKVVVRKGQIYATGVIYSEGQSFTVLRARRLAIKAVADAEVEFVCPFTPSTSAVILILNNFLPLLPTLNSAPPPEGRGVRGVYRPGACWHLPRRRENT